MNSKAPEDYRAVLCQELAARKSSLGRAYTQAKMATACRVQKTYLSRVLNGEAHFSRDQLFLACEFLGTKPRERDLLLLSLDFHRSTVPALRTEIKKRFVVLRDEMESAKERLHADVIDATAGNLADYYLNPDVQLAHILLSIESFRREPSRIAAALGIDVQTIPSVVSRLQRMGLVEIGKGGVKLTRENLHLPTESPLYSAHRALLRHRANDRMYALPPDASYTFSVVFSATETERQAIKAMFLDFLERVEALVGRAASEDAYQMNFDLLKWT